MVDQIRTKITYQKKFVVALLKFGKKSLEKRSEYSFIIESFTDKSYRMLVTIPEAFLDKSKQNIWIVEALLLPPNNMCNIDVSFS